jgi:outer membrane lipoprotein
MKGRISFRFGIAVFLLGFLGGCAYPLSQKVQNFARKDLTYPVVVQSPKKYDGTTVIWGGMISDVRNGKDGGRVAILEAPLDRRGNPQLQTIRGMFIAKSDRYLDPKVYQKGKKVTLAGDVLGEETKTIGAVPYIYPVILILELHLWDEPLAKLPENFKESLELGIPFLSPFEEPPGGYPQEDPIGPRE